MQNKVISYILLWKFIEAVLVTFLGIAFVIFADRLSITIIISSHSATGVSSILFIYFLFSQIHVLGFQV